MDNETLILVLTPLLSFLGTIVGAIANNKLQKYRIEMLEKRIKRVEERIENLQHEINSGVVDIEKAKQDIDVLHREIKELKHTTERLIGYHMK